MLAGWPLLSLTTLIARAAGTLICSASRPTACRRASWHPSSDFLDSPPTVAVHAARNSSASCLIAAFFHRRCRQPIVGAAILKGRKRAGRNLALGISPWSLARALAPEMQERALDLNRRHRGSSPDLRARVAVVAVLIGPRSPCRPFRNPPGVTARIAPRSAC